MKRKRFSNSGKRSILPIILTLLLIGGGVISVYAWKSAQSFTSDASQAVSSDNSEAEILSTESTTSDAKTVCLDPGHGGEGDPGAVNDDVIERDINLIVANKMKALLIADGYNVVMTRTSNDEVLDNKARAAYCNAQSADILLSIHHNDYTDNVTDYASAIYYKDEDQELAQYILDAIATDLDIINNGLTTLEDNVLVKSNMPAALSEAFFVSSNDEKVMIDAYNSTRLGDEASALVKGIENYFSREK